GRAAGPMPVPDDLKGRAAADGRHPSRHVCVQADADHAHHDHPCQCQPEPGTDYGVGDQIADVEETPNGGEYSEGYGKDPAHQRYPLSRAPAAAARSSRAFSGAGSCVMLRTVADAALS